jgi:hypothetical protein
MLEPLQSHGYNTIIAELSRPSAADIRATLQTVEAVLVDVTAASPALLTMIHDLSAVIGFCDVAPRLLCFSTTHRNSRFARDLEKCGARYERIGNSGMLCEAIDRLLADVDELRRNGPSFLVLHRFANGACAAGEEISAVLCPWADPNPQLPLALSERCVFNLLASYRRVALDARQIAATLDGEWFYRDHAANSGAVQRVKVRAPAVKVLIGRIRDAMRLKFAEAHLQLDPFDVLQSVPTIGSNRVLYRLRADVRFIHSAD